jgi:hypothetical protein
VTLDYLGLRPRSTVQETLEAASVIDLPLKILTNDRDNVITFGKAL